MSSTVQHVRAAQWSAHRHALKIHFHYELSTNTTQDERNYLQKELLPTAAAVLKQFIQVKHPSADGILRLTPPCEDGWKVCTNKSCKTSCLKWAARKCGRVKFPKEHLDALETCNASERSTGVPPGNCKSTRAGKGVEADLIVYVTNYDQCQGNNIASSRFCAADTLTNRPVAGGLDFCNFGRHQFRDDLMVSVHEMIHILGMSARFFNVTANPHGDAKFINSDLSPKKLGEVVEAYTSAKGRKRYRVITPSVRAASARHFNCPSLRGGTLEDDLGEGSVNSHWDRRLYQGEIMDPVAGENTAVGRHVITNVTLALLQDTGWYTVDYRASGFNHWGYQAGCQFAESPAKEVRASQDSAVQRFTCRNDVSAATKCTVDLTSLGVCTTDASFDGLSHVQEESPHQACLRSDTLSFNESEAAYGQYHGPGSRCILQSAGFAREGFEMESPQASAGCYRTLCKGEPGNRQLYIEFEGPGIQVACPSGAYVDLSTVEGLDFTGQSLLGPCPSREVLCGRGEYEEGLRECGGSDCSANGDCLRGRCHCHIGYVGAACDQEICIDDSNCERDMVCHWSGQCLTVEEALKSQFEIQAITPEEFTAPSSGSSSGFSHREKLAIMFSMGGLLLVISVICAWLLLRNSRRAQSSSRQRGTGGVVVGVVRQLRWGGDSGSGSNSGTPSLQLSGESGFTPRSTSGTPPTQPSSKESEPKPSSKKSQPKPSFKEFKPKPKKSPLSQSRATPGRLAPPSRSFSEQASSDPPFFAVQVEAIAGPNSL